MPRFPLSREFPCIGSAATFALSTALSLLPASFSAQPTQETPSIAAARKLLRKGMDSEADAALRAFLVLNPKSAEAHFLLGYALFAEHKPKESLTEFTAGTRLAPPSPDDLRCVALDYVLLGDYPDADHWLSQAISLNHSNSETWYSLGRVRYTEGQYESARDCFLKVLELAPRNVKAEDNLGLAYQELHQTDSAVAAFRFAIAWQDTATHRNEQPYLNLASLFMDQNRLDDAFPLLVEASSISPSNPTIHKQLGIFYSRRNQLEKAEEQFQLAVDADPDDAPLHFLLGQVCRNRGNKARAQVEFARAAELEQKQDRAPLP